MKLKNYVCLLSIFSLLSSPQLWANGKDKEKDELDINVLALPSEVKGIGKGSGAIFYSPSIKGKILIPVSIWGEVKKSGLHFLPIETSLVQGISLAGGPTNAANLKTVKISRTNSAGAIESQKYDLRYGGGQEASLKILKPGDTVFIEKSTFSEDRAYYTSLFGVVATILSTILIYRQVKD